MASKVVVACGSGVATSEMVAARPGKMLEQASGDVHL